MRVGEALAQAVARLASAAIPDAPRDARRLVAHALGVAPDRVTLMRGEPLPDAAAARLQEAVAARLERRPVSQITGWREFYGRRFRVTADVLDPRPETETLVDLALSVPFDHVLDLGTGSGCLLLTLMAERDARGTGTDVSETALQVAAENAALLDLSPRLLTADWFAGLSGQWDLIVSNPPYIAEAELEALSPEVRLWEPRGALTPGGDGLGAYRAIARGARAHLSAKGRLIVEIGAAQAAEVAAILADAGLDDLTRHRDLDGRDRAICARRAV